MLRTTFLSLTLAASLSAASMQQLFEGLKHHYQTQLSDLEIRQSLNALDLVRAQLYPKILLFGSVTHYNSPTNLRPVTPTENAAVTPDLPFSRDISRVGAALSMPVFVASLYTLADKATLMQRSARAKKRIDLLKNEATLVGANANLRYLEAMQNALRHKEKTLRTTERILKLKVRNGRAPESALLKVREHLDQTEIALNDIAIQRQNVLALIENLSGIRLKKSVPMRSAGRLKSGRLAPLRPLEIKAEADRLTIETERKKLYPSLHLNADISRGYAKSYLSDRHIRRDYGNVGLTLSVPLVDMGQYRTIEKARIAAQKSQTQLALSAHELQTRARSRQEQLRLLRRSLTLRRRDIGHQKRLLKIAESSYLQGRMSLEEYLRYLDALLDARARYAQDRAKYWQTLAELAFLYGNPLETIIH